MKGSVREVRPGYWQMRVYLGRDPITKRDRYKTKAVRAKSRKDAESHLPRFIVDLQESPGFATQGTVAYLLDEVIAHMRDRDAEPTTLRSYEGIARQVRDAFGTVRFCDLKPQHLNNYYTAKRRGGASSGTISNHHRFLHRAFALAVKWGYADSNVADRADPPAVHRKRIEAPSNDKVKALLAAARRESVDLWAALMLLAALGCRRGELCGLRWGDIDLDTGAVTIRRAVKDMSKAEGGLLVRDTKTHRVRDLTVGPTVLIALSGFRAQIEERAQWASVILSADAYVISDDPQGLTPWRPDRLTKAVVRLREKVGYTGRLHDLRHWNTSELLDAGEDVTVVAERQGHADTATTHNIYGHMKPAADLRAAGIIDEALFGDDELRKRRKGA